jgi:DNA-binding MarR family transcriptional regulator
MRDLSRAVLVTPGGVTRLVARLEERQLVQRVRNHGRQAVVTRLTDKGEERLRGAMEVHFGGVKRMFVSQVSDLDIDRMLVTWSRIREVGLAPDSP